jgi:hypothetical protein
MPEFQFDLRNMRSYKTTGYYGEKVYVFKKGTPVTVDSPEDAQHFRNQPEIFVEINQQGFPVAYNSVRNHENRTYKRFRQENIVPHDPEELLRQAYEQSVVARQSGVDVNKLLEIASEDSNVKNHSKDKRRKGENKAIEQAVRGVEMELGEDETFQDAVVAAKKRRQEQGLEDIQVPPNFEQPGATEETKVVTSQDTGRDLDGDVDQDEDAKLPDADLRSEENKSIADDASSVNTEKEEEKQHDQLAQTEGSENEDSNEDETASKPIPKKKSSAKKKTT